MGTVYKGWNARVFIDAVEVACCESASVEIANSLEAYYCIGNKNAYAIVEGNQEITGSISRALVNTTYLSLVAGTSTGLSSFDIQFYVYGGTNNTFGVWCYGCKFETGSIDIPADGVLKEDYDFRATMLTVVTVS